MPKRRRSSPKWEPTSSFSLKKFPRRMSQFELYSFLCQYGTIMNIETDYSGEVWVVYQRTDATDRLKPESVLPIDSRKTMTIEWVYDDRWRNYGKWNTSKAKRARSLALAPDQTDDSHILNALNDDCIRSIIETSVFDAVGLYEIAKVCTRFRYIARQVFEAKFRNKTWFYRTLLFWQPLSLIEDFFRIFGPSITSLDFGQHYNGDTINGIIEKYCTSLEKMKCEVTQTQTQTELRLLANRVKQLFIRCSRFIALDLNDAFGAGSPTEVLSVSSAEARLILPTAELTNLKDVRIINAHLTNVTKLKTFFRKNEQVEHLLLQNVGLSIGIEQILQLLPNLQSISLYFSLPRLQCDDYECFGQLKHLKSLKMMLDTRHSCAIIDTLVKHQTQLESLLFFMGTAETGIENAICQIKSLKVLEIDCVHGNRDLVRFVQELPNLTELKVNIIGTDAAMSLIRHAHDRLTEMSFVITHEERMDSNSILLDDKLKAIWHTAQTKDIRLTVVMLFNLNEIEIPVSVDFWREHRKWLSYESNSRFYQRRRQGNYINYMDNRYMA